MRTSCVTNILKIASKKDSLIFMNSPISINFPINSLSFGNVSVAILRELYRAEQENGLFPNETPAILPIGPVEIKTQRPDAGFSTWLQNILNSSLERVDSKEPCFKLWHINGAIESVSSYERNLLTFHETNSLTPTEINILNNQNSVFVTSSYTEQVFDSHGVTARVIHLPLGFDDHNFKVLEKRPTIDGVISFFLGGKMEERKQTLRQLSLWARKYGNNRRYALNVCISNPHIKVEDQNALIHNALEGKRFFNINFLPYAATNEEYNKVLQSSHIHLGCSLNEGFDLPLYHATAMGAWPVALNAHVYKDYLNNENAILVEPSKEMVKAHDGIFFNFGRGPFNQGYWPTFSDDAFIAACEEAEKRVAEKGLNTEGLKLQQRTYKQVAKELFAGYV